MSSESQGFTIVELVVVIVVLAVLFAIVVPLFYNITDSATSASKKSSSGAIMSALGMYKLEYLSHPSVTSLTNYLHDNQFTATSAGILVTINEQSVVIPTFTNVNCTDTTTALADSVACVGEASD